MTVSPRTLVLTVAMLLVSACATKPAPVIPPAVVATLPPPRPAMPAGGAPGMVIPAVLPDGTYPTPNRGVSSAGATWHLRAALNVAALACRGPEEAGIVAGYNAMLAAHKIGLRDAEARLSAEYRVGGGSAAAARDRYDDAMTRLYNFFSQSFARDGFCRAAATALTEVASVAPGSLEGFSVSRLPLLEQPFTDFYRAYNAWRRGGVAAPATTFAVAQPGTSAPVAPRASSVPQLPGSVAPTPAVAFPTPTLPN